MFNVLSFLAVIGGTVGVGAWLKRAEITAYFSDVDARIDRAWEVDQ